MFPHVAPEHRDWLKSKYVSDPLLPNLAGRELIGAEATVYDLEETLPDPPGPTTPKMSAVQAKQAGYTGDVCSKCGSTRVVVSGYCTKCEDCGEQGGCG